MDKTDIKSMTMKELTDYLEAMGEKKFHAKQIYTWMHVRHAASFDEMTDLSKKLRQTLKDTCACSRPKLVAMQESQIDGTRKYLFELEDGCRVESVLMKYRHGNSVCISSQAGCRMGCTFCASTIGGLIRSLTPAEMLEQVYSIGDDIGARISNVVVMGMGEPLDNFGSLLKFITMLTDEHGLHISQRNLTVSTCGLVPGIRALAEQHFAITLALSLHASSQEKREKLMPIARKYQLEDVMDACDYYFRETGRRITFEYSLIAGVNDTETDAEELQKLLHGKNCHINLIPVNPVRETGYRTPDSAAVSAFKNKLEKYGINVTIRREMGRDIDGACGQLRKRLAER
jgi:23S rRNA (adenine2503-C2)-methyltransferase